MRLALPISAPMPPIIPLGRKFHGSSAQSRKKANTFTPLGSPRGTGTFRKNLNTTVKITMVASGFSNDHVQPRTERLYFPRSSRNVRFVIRSRVVASSEMRVMLDRRPKRDWSDAGWRGLGGLDAD